MQTCSAIELDKNQTIDQEALTRTTCFVCMIYDKAIQLLGLVEKNPNNSDFLGSKIKEMQHLIKDD